MRKIELIEMCKDHLAGGDAPADVKGKYHDEIITKFIEAAYEDLLYEVYIQSKKYSDFSPLDNYTETFTRTVTADGVNAGTIELPFPLVALPDNAGVRQVMYTNDESSGFSYLETNSDPVWSELEVDSVDENPEFRYYREDNKHKMYLQKMADNTTEVKVKLVVPLSYMDISHHVPMPAGKEGRVFDFVVERLRGKNTEDIINDNIANQQ